MHHSLRLAVALAIYGAGCIQEFVSARVASTASVEAAGEARSPDPLDIKRILAMVRNQQGSKDAAQNETDRYAWDLFVLMNWPASSDNPTLPNLTASIADGGPRVWEGLKQTSDVFLSDGGKPGPWEQRHRPPQEVLNLAKAQGLPLDQPFHDLDEQTQVDGLVFKDKYGNLIRYQILMNEVTFNYVRDHGLYNINGQEAVANGTAQIAMINFRWDAMELKTSWLWLDPANPAAGAIAESYFTANAYFETFDAEGKHTGWTVGRAALTGMHIITKALPGWVWTTFEHVDNGKYTRATIELGIPKNAAEANTVYQKALAGTVFAKYQLVGTQIHYVQPGGKKPTLVANSQIESAFQRTSSCITCHAMASIAKKSDIPLRFPFIDTSGGNVKYYVGDPPDMPDYAKMNFVWSLRRAKRAK